ncbi:MAG: RagB/SusD family nutrient uptake outer membrane protein [Prolixibacteraceae bacterium]|nr:RagB/SusD family nutrient uptake outer membrane protein [Prolixibacteraceae bacterium]
MTTINKDTVFNDIKYAERFLFGAYGTLPWPIKYNVSQYYYLENLTDICSAAKGLPAYYNGTITAVDENTGVGAGKFNYYSGAWGGIRICNIFIANIDKVPSASETYKRQLKAEARAIMATLYCNLYRHYGGIMWINKDLPVTTIGEFPRLTARATMDSIVALCDKAIPDLPWVIDDIINWEGRFTKAGAMGIKARTLLFGASPLFNSATPYKEGEAATRKLMWNGSYDANLWIKARDAAKELITRVESEGGYVINKSTGNYRKDFQNAYFTRGYGETLISTRRSYLANTSDTYGIVWYNGVVNYTQEYVDMFPMANGKPITDPTSGYDPKNPYVNRDPRLYESVLVNGDAYQGRKAELWIGGKERVTVDDSPTYTGYGPRKFILDHDNVTLGGAIEQFPLLRLPEIYLSYAEAENEVNNGPTAEAYRCVNIVRNRVGLGNLPSGLSKENFREAVLNERALEFAMEEVRWFDIVRWKREDVFKKQLHGMRIYKAGNVLTYELFPLDVRNWSINWNPKWYLSAFPYLEIQKNYGLIQNPGWEI